MAVPQGSLLLYGVDTNRLVTFDPVRKVVDATGSAPQTFQYPFADRQDLYTSGSSTDYGFELLRVRGNDIRALATVDGRRGLFPLASDGDVTLLTLVDYDGESRVTNQQVVRLAGSALVPVPGLDHSGIAGGALLDGVLHDTVQRERSERYDLRRVDLDRRGSRPRTVRTGLRHGPLHTFRGTLVVDYRVARSRSKPVDCSYYCLFSDAAGAVVTVAPNDSADLELSVFDPVSGRTFGSATGAVTGFTLDGGVVEAYGTGLHKTIAITR